MSVHTCHVAKLLPSRPVHSCFVTFKQMVLRRAWHPPRAMRCSCMHALCLIGMWVHALCTSSFISRNPSLAFLMACSADESFVCLAAFYKALQARKTLIAEYKDHIVRMLANLDRQAKVLWRLYCHICRFGFAHSLQLFAAGSPAAVSVCLLVLLVVCICVYACCCWKLHLQ